MENKIPTTVGLLAHVDAGKTTLSEALLYVAGVRRTLGRVDHRDAWLDTHNLERARGITIFSKQAQLPEQHITLLDTPGHVDFAPEAERVMPVLSCAVLVISGTDGVQAHTITLWQLLRRYAVPTFLFLNKMDLPGKGREELMQELQESFGPGFVDFTQPQEAIWENAALCDEALLETYLETGTVTEGNLRELIAHGKLFPCCFGSGLKLQGVDTLLELLTTYAPRQDFREEFAAKVYKISRDPQGNRLTWLKVTGGSLSVRTALSYETAKGDKVEEKIQQLRIYSGEKFTAVQQVLPGQICAATGLSQTWIGQSLGAEPEGKPPLVEPVMSYRIALPSGTDPMTVLPKLRQLEEEDPTLHILWEAGQIHAQVMGKVQQEILKSLIYQRFSLEVQLTDPKIHYRETIENTVEGVGHFEPLRHYAEVHLLLEPLPQGSGLVFDTRCPLDVLDVNYQKLILTHLQEKTHRGVLTGAPITDNRYTYSLGKAHLKHTEGGDFRQATYRAVRQGLMEAQSRLLEPWYRFTLIVPSNQVGRAITDIRAMGGLPEPPENRRGKRHPHRAGACLGAGGLCPAGGGLHPGKGAAPAEPSGLRSLPQPGGGGGGGRVQPGGRFGKHPGLRILRPRRRLHGKMEPGQRLYALGERPAGGKTPGAAHPESPGGRQGAGGHHAPGVWPHEAAPLPGPGKPPGKGGNFHPSAPAALPDCGRLQHDFRLGWPVRHRQNRPGRRPAAAAGQAQQLHGLYQVPDGGGI